MKKSYEQKQLELHEKSLALFQEAETKHVRLLEIEEKAESINPEDPDYEHFNILLDLAYLMRDQVDIAIQSEILKMEKPYAINTASNKSKH